MKKLFLILVLCFVFSLNSVCFAETAADFDISTTTSPEEIKSLAEKAVQSEVGSLSNSQKNVVDELFSKISIPKQELKKIMEKIDSADDITQEEQDLLEIQLQKEILEEINDVIGAEITDMQQQLADSEKLKDELTNVTKTTDEYASKIEELEKNHEDLKNKISEKEAIINENKKHIEELSEAEVMKNYLLQQNLELKKLLEKVENKKIEGKMFVLYVGITFLVVVYLIKYLLKRKHKSKYLHHFTYFDLIWGFATFIFLVWFFFYVKPEMTIILFFSAAGLIVVSKDFIISLFASLLIINEFHIGDKIRFNGQEGIIVKIRPLWLVIRNIDHFDHASGEARRIPNYIFMSNEVIRIRRKEEKEYFKLSLNRDYKLNIFQILKYIETEILQKNITTKMRNEVTGEEIMYDLDYRYNDDGEPVIEITWKESRERSRRIKKKIMAYISSMIFVEENKDDNLNASVSGDDSVKSSEKDKRDGDDLLQPSNKWIKPGNNNDKK